MKRQLSAAAFCVCVIGATLSATIVASAQERALSEVQVREALARQDQFKPLMMSEALNLNASGFRIEIVTPSGWIQSIAREAKREMRPFGLADVTDEMRADVWRVRAWPSTPRKINQTASASSVDHVVIRNAAKTIVIQPLSKEPFTDSVHNAFGTTLSYTGVVAAFPAADVRELWGSEENQPFWVSVIGPNWKYDFEVKPKHFERLRDAMRTARDGK